MRKEYKRQYNKIFRDLLDNHDRGALDECALPSYNHRNKLMSWLFWRRIRIAFRMVGDLTNKKVLDFGCGAGVCFKYFADRQCHITGCDLVYGEIAKKVSRILDIETVIYSSIDDITDNEYDVVFALDVLEHVDDLNHFIEQIYRLGKRGSKLIVSGPSESSLYRFGRFLAGFSGEYHKRNIYDIEQALSAGGLKLSKIANLYSPFPLFRISSWVIKQ